MMSNELHVVNDSTRVAAATPVAPMDYCDTETPVATRLLNLQLSAMQ